MNRMLLIFLEFFSSKLVVANYVGESYFKNSIELEFTYARYIVVVLSTPDVKSSTYVPDFNILLANG